MMLGRALRARGRAERGQALVLGAVLGLVIVIAVLTTVNVGHAVHERVRLQNTADAAAYSMAAVEARAFNLYSFANRAQVSHYVSAMVWQSTASFIYFLEAFTVDLVAMVRTLNLCRGPLGPACRLVPGLTQVQSAMALIERVARAAALGVQALLDTFDVDELVGRRLIPAHALLNGVLAASSAAVMRAAGREVRALTPEVIRANDPNLDLARAQAATGALAECFFDRAHMVEANGNLSQTVDAFAALDPTATSDADKRSKAKRVMGAISNATRFACDATRARCDAPDFVTNRDEAQLLRPLRLQALARLVGDFKYGQTRLLSHDRNEPPAKENRIRQWNSTPSAPMGMLDQGDYLGADDLYRLTLGPLSFVRPGADPKSKGGWGAGMVGVDRRDERQRQARLPFHRAFETSIWALNPHQGTPGGVHYRLARGQDPRWPRPNAPTAADRRLGLNREMVTPAWASGGAIVPGLKVPVFVANVVPVEDGNHTWQGIMPFTHFEPGEYASVCGDGGGAAMASASQAAVRQHEFNQPSTWVRLNKTAAQMKNPLADPSGAGSNRPAALHVTSPLGGAELELDNVRAKPLGDEGLTALARGQTYYHRPGNWAEQPNFFNPYWKPRLAPVLQAAEGQPLVDDLLQQLPPSMQARPQRVVTH